MALYNSFKTMGIWVITFLLAWLQVKKKIPGWEEHAVRVKLHNVLAAKLSQEAELAAFPQPLILTFVQEFTAHEFPFMPIPQGVMVWVRPLLWSGLKITLPKPTPSLRPADCVFAPWDTGLLWHSVVQRQRQKTVSGATFSGSKASVWLARHRIQAMQIQPFPCCRVLEIHITPKHQHWEFLIGFAVVQTKNFGGHWSYVLKADTR